MHHNFDDSDSGYDLEGDGSKGKAFGMGGYRGRIIFLGDGTEVLTDSAEAGEVEEVGDNDAEMFDNNSGSSDASRSSVGSGNVSSGGLESEEDEDRDLVSQVGGGEPAKGAQQKEETAKSAESEKKEAIKKA